MDDLDLDDVILFLLPHRGEGFDGALHVTTLHENKSRVVVARHDEPKQSDIDRQERGGTEIPEERGLLENTDCLVLRFSHGARTHLGVVVGCAAASDLIFQGIAGISKFHLAFTFDDQNIPIAKDLGSTGGTKVTYNEEKGQRLSNFDWSLIGPSIANGKPPILNITDTVQFKVIVPHRDSTSSGYIDKVKKFRMGTADPEGLLASFIIDSGKGTRLATGQQTPPTDSQSSPTLYQKYLVRGAFGAVKYVWNMTTREEYVVKKPLKKLINNGKVDEESWREEAEIMRSISHVRTGISAFSYLLRLTA